jgi:hypothetical protein
MTEVVPEITTKAQISDEGDFDYGAPAELFYVGNKKKFSTKRYWRFDTAAEAVRFAIENIPAPALHGAYLEVEERRFGVREINELYENKAYPLNRGRQAK